MICKAHASAYGPVQLLVRCRFMKYSFAGNEGNAKQKFANSFAYTNLLFTKPKADPGLEAATDVAGTKFPVTKNISRLRRAANYASINFISDKKITNI